MQEDINQPLGFLKLRLNSDGNRSRLKAFKERYKVDERIALFIDGANLHATTRALGFDIDFARLLNEFEKRGRLVRAYFYTALSEEGDFSNLRPLIDWLSYNGFTVRTKPVKEFDDGDGRRRVKRNMAVELAVDAMELASTSSPRRCATCHGDN